MREPRAYASMGTCEGHPVVGTDSPRQAELLECSLEDGEGVDLFGGRQGPTGEQVAAGKVGDGKRATIAPVGEHEFIGLQYSPAIV